jgi:predicted permease
VGLLSAGYDTSRARIFADQLVDHLRATGAVDSVALAQATPFNPSGPYALAPIATDSYQPAKDEQPAAAYNAVSPGYFGTLGIPLIRGRDFTHADDDGSTAVSIVSEGMAARYWPGGDPVGRRLKVRDRWTQVVGLVKDIKYQSLGRPAEPLFYVPLRQRMSTGFVVQARTRNGIATFRAEYERALHELDPNVVAYETISMREQLARSTSTQRLASTVFGVFASVALVLAALGLYGVMSYVVTQSTRELGLRMALGAQPRTVLALVLSRGLQLTSVGVVIGLGVALGTTRLLGDLLYKVDPRDPVVFASGLAVMVIATSIACTLPAWRAARTDLVRALRV